MPQAGGAGEVGLDVGYEVVAVFLDQAGPTVVGNLAGLVVRRLRALVGHLEEQQIRQLLDACPEPRRRVVAIAHAIVAEDVAVVPEFLNDLG